jgi:transmembrane sensor
VNQKDGQKDLYALIEDYRKGVCTPQEIALLYKWLNEMDTTLPEAERAQWSVLRSSVRDQVWEQQELLMHRSGARIRPFHVVRWVAAASILAVFALAYYLFYMQRRTSAPPGAGNGMAVQKTFPPPDSVIRNTSRHTSRHALPDGSVAWLFPGTTISLKASWPKDDRHIFLHGKATFFAARDPHHPFSIYTNRFSTTALGTLFTVVAYDSMRISHVKLLNGRIVIRSRTGTGEVFLSTAGQEYAVDGRTGTLTPFHDPAPAGKMLVEPVNGIMQFDHTPLADVFRSLGKAYAAEVRLDPGVKLDGMTFTGSVRTSEPLAGKLSALTLLNNLVLVRLDSTYVIKAK